MSKFAPKSIGLFVGSENSWPTAFIEAVQSIDPAITTEFVKLDGVKIGDPVPYNVIIDRMSHYVPFYRAYLKYASLKGAYIINDPFRWSADDKAVGITLLQRLGIVVPKTVILPNKSASIEMSPENFRNLKYPMDWEGIVNYVGVPAIFKDIHTGGRQLVYRVHDVDDLIDLYDQSGQLTMVLQEIVESEHHIHCFVIGQEKVLLTEYSLTDAKYLPNLDLSMSLQNKIIEDAAKITKIYSYDINMVEFVLRGQQPIVINPTNPVPNIDFDLLTEEQFHWVVQQIVDLAISKISQSQSQMFNWKV